jgi:hypothetical protein
MGRSKKFPRKRYLLLVFALGLIAILACTPFAKIDGKEFSPNAFQTRYFSYYRLPFTKLRVSRTTLTIPDQATEREILKHISRPSSEELWHPVALAPYDGTTKYPAALLFDSLARRTPEGNHLWASWSALHPNQAAALWPFIQSMAMHNLYLEIPEILQFAENYQGPDDQFKSELHSFAYDLVNQRRDLYMNHPDWENLQAWLDPLIPPQKSNTR